MVHSMPPTEKSEILMPYATTALLLLPCSCSNLSLHNSFDYISVTCHRLLPNDLIINDKHCDSNRWQHCDDNIAVTENSKLHFINRRHSLREPQQSYLLHLYTTFVSLRETISFTPRNQSFRYLKLLVSLLETRVSYAWNQSFPL